MTYKEARVYLDEMSKYGSVLGLDTIRGLLRELGNPQDDLKFIHIAGTNGKGSVLAYTSMILSKAGYKTGRYVSPTVISYLEKIQVDGKWISESEFAEIMEEIKEAIDRLVCKGEPVPTVFEVETAMAFLYFKKQKCDLVVLEAGLGGELGQLWLTAKAGAKALTGGPEGLALFPQGAAHLDRAVVPEEAAYLAGDLGDGVGGELRAVC